MDIFNPKQLALLQIDPQQNASLQTHLANKNISLLQLLSIKQMQQKIRSNFTYFIKHCQKNEEFCFNLIDLGIKSSLQQGANENIKQAYFIATDALTCDQDIVADLLILPDRSKPYKKHQSGDESEQFQEIEENIETEPENSAGPPEVDLIDQSLSEEERFNKKYKYLMRVLEYIYQNETKSLDENCINYMIKAMNCLIRKKAEELLEFLLKKSQVLKKLIELNNFSSVDQFLIKILSDDQTQGQNPQQVKKIIIQGVLKKLKDSIGSEDFGQRLDFLEELFQTNKYASEDDRTQLQKLSDIFSSKELIQFFYDHLQNPQSPTEFLNSISYLSVILKRMNVDQEIDPYSYSNEPREQTMIFEIDVLFKEFPKILTNGYQSLINLQYAQQYKQKIMETKYYEFLVLLTKNSRLSNNSQDIKQGALTNLKGNNIIFESQQHKINTLKQLLVIISFMQKQFSTQARSGINRINIIALIQKVLNVQIYNEVHHPKTTNNLIDSVQSHNQVKEVQKGNDTHQAAQNNNEKHQKVMDHTIQVEEQNTNEDKKMKINKIKAGLKLNIKKFSLQHIDSDEKPLQTEAPSKTQEESANIKKLEISLKKDEVLYILEFFSQILKGIPEFTKTGAKKKFKNNQSEISALINKLIIIFSDSIWWPAENEDVLNKQKDEFITQVQTIFPLFSFEQISRNYSTTLATSKHPNAAARQKTNPELNFSTDFSKMYSKKKDIPVQKNKQSSGKNLELSDSDFKSQDQEEDVHAVKCTLEDFKKFTGFKFQNQQSPKSNSVPPTQRSNVEESNLPVQTKAPWIVEEIKQEKEKLNQSKVPEVNVQKNEKQEKANIPIQVTKNEEIITTDKSQNIKLTEETKEAKEQVKIVMEKSKSKVKQQQNVSVHKVPLEFYIKHRVIFV